MRPWWGRYAARSLMSLMLDGRGRRPKPSITSRSNSARRARRFRVDTPAPFAWRPDPLQVHRAAFSRISSGAPPGSGCAWVGLGNSAPRSGDSVQDVTAGVVATSPSPAIAVGYSRAQIVANGSPSIRRFKFMATRAASNCLQRLSLRWSARHGVTSARARAIAPPGALGLMQRGSPLDTAAKPTDVSLGTDVFA